MNQKTLLKLQSKRGAKTVATGDIVLKQFDAVLKECHNYIREKSEKYRNMNASDKKENIKALITEYIMTNKPLVEGYVDETNNLDVTKLLDKMIEEITDYGILTAAILDESIFEIRANGRELLVEQHGRVVPLTDRDGNIVRFSSPEQQEVIMKKLMGDVRLTPKDALTNSRTLEGYRIAAVHSSAMGDDPNDPLGPKYNSFVLRKFKKTKLSLEDLIKGGSLSDDMGKLLSLLPAGGTTFLTVGATGSGKSTLNNAILQNVPPSTRVVLIQNPSEIDLRMKDETGRMYNDVLHLEGKEITNPSPTDPTVENEMDHVLRLTPQFVCLGETRTNKEFALLMKILNVGHSANTTYHASDSKGAISRFLTGYLAVSNEPSHLALKTLTTLVDIIVVQKLMRDGSRKTIQISEVCGVDPNNREEPLIRDLYVYELDDNPVIDETGKVVKITGRHKRVNPISERLIHKFRMEGVPKKDYEFLTKSVLPNEVQTYNGNIG